MTVVVRCTDEVVRHIEYRLPQNPSTSFELVRPRNEWENRKVIHLALLVVDRPGGSPAVAWLCRAQRGRKVATFDCHVVFDRIRRVDPLLRLVEIEAVDSRLGPATWSTGAPLTREMSERVDTAATTARPGLTTIIEEVLRNDDRGPTGRRGEELADEKDAAGVLFDIAQMDRAELGTWRPPADDDAPFLAGIDAGRPSREDDLINHDAGRFMDWTGQHVPRIETRVFESGGRRLAIMNANRGDIETRLGVDIVYFHEQLQSFVLVQYKKLRREGKDWWYRPDRHLEPQLQRMRKVDDACAEAEGDFRLLPTPCLVKICRPQILVTEEHTLITGMYLPRQLLEDLLAKEALKGPNDGTRLGFENVSKHSRYLTNTQFTELVRQGWIGSRGTGTDYVFEQVRESLGTTGTVVFGVLTGAS